MFSKSCKNAIRAVLYLAIHSDEDRKLGVDSIATELGVSRHFLAKTLQLLAKADFISSARGPNGGFYLNAANRRSNLLSIIRYMDGPESVSECVLGLPNCSNDNPCPFHVHVKKFRDGLNQFLFMQSIEEAAKRISQEDLRF